MIPYGKQYINKQDINSVLDVLKSSFLTTGPVVEKFENNLKKYTGGKYCVSCGNGTEALHLAYLAIGVGKGDEIITTANTFVATSNMIIACGARPVFCDIEMSNYNIDANKIEALITSKTKAISVVHFSGKPCNMKKVWEVAKKYNLKVIEDAAHALGASYNDTKIGNTQSDLTTFSFHPVKPITTGEGGAILTNDKEYYLKMLKFRSHGIIRDENGYNDMVSFGYNYRITDIQCALGITQLKKLDKFIKYRKNIVKIYNKYLSCIDSLILPKNDDISDSGWHLYIIRLKDKNNRDKLLNILRESGYGVTLHYPPVYNNTYYRENGYKDIKLKKCELYFETCISLPIFYKLEESEIKNISTIIKNNI